jgi:hypothetical protein
MSFLLKNKTTYCKITSYYIIDGNLYQFKMMDFLKDGDVKLSRVDLFNKFGFHVSKFNLEFDEFEEWASQYYDNFDALPYDMNTAQEINEKDLVKAVKKFKSDFEKKFKDFPLDGTLYTSTLDRYDDMQCFQEVVKPRKKLVNENDDHIARRLFLEVEVLDGKSSETKREFMPFCRFIEYYKSGCAIKVIESDDYVEKRIEDFFNL